ncbi:MAG TPA: C4-type zinc ribbon domain-containing protein [Terriglobales bacterium]|nr:C4-type zinc ribbon domain-containing protein [Terriglobales bacterium]
MNPDLEKLIELQRVEREIARLTAEVAALPKRMATIEAQLADTKGQVEKAKSAISANLADRKKQEQKIQDEQQKISKYRDQSLGVKTNEQYKALLQEIKFAEDQIRACEDRILEGMVGNEELEKKLKVTENELKAEAAEIEKEKAEARAVTAKDEAELADWNGQRDRLRSGITPSHLAYYDRVAAVRKNALAEARDHKCSACQVMLRPQTYNEVRTNSEIMACDSCQRILYYDPAHEPAPVAYDGKGRKIHAGSAWLYLSDSGYGAVFIFMQNLENSCRKRYFDADTGRALDRVEVSNHDYKHAFAGELRVGRHLNYEAAPSFEDEQLAPEALAELRREVAETHQAEAPATQ